MFSAFRAAELSTPMWKQARMIIMGTVEDSILFRDVTVEAGAVIKHAIIMQGTVVRSGADIEYAIVDKDAEITEDRTLIGAQTAPIIIPKGEKI